jgi:hypothetical protein
MQSGCSSAPPAGGSAGSVLGLNAVVLAVGLAVWAGRRRARGG